MTLAEIEELDVDFLTVQEVASCLHTSPQLIRDQATVNIRYLGFPICKSGHAFKIPRLGFLAWAKGEIPMVAYPTGFSEMACQR